MKEKLLKIISETNYDPSSGEATYLVVLGGKLMN